MSGSPVHAPSRLVVNGSRVLQPDGSPIRLTGFNWQIGRVGPDPGAEMRTLAPGANVARLVGVLWGNALPLGERHPDRDCMTTEPPHFFDDECFSTLDPLVRSATDAGLWVILAVLWAVLWAAQWVEPWEEWAKLLEAHLVVKVTQVEL